MEALRLLGEVADGSDAQRLPNCEQAGQSQPALSRANGWSANSPDIRQTPGSTRILRISANWGSRSSVDAASLRLSGISDALRCPMTMCPSCSAIQRCDDRRLFEWQTLIVISSAPPPFPSLPFLTRFP